MHTLLVVEIIFYAIALLLFIACCTAFIRKWFMNVVILLGKTYVRAHNKKDDYHDKK